jgi:hypothetical protein
MFTTRYNRISEDLSPFKLLVAKVTDQVGFSHKVQFTVLLEKETEVRQNGRMFWPGLFQFVCLCFNCLSVFVFVSIVIVYLFHVYRVNKALGGQKKLELFKFCYFNKKGYYCKNKIGLRPASWLCKSWFLKFFSNFLWKCPCLICAGLK